MARKVQNARIDTRSARGKLPKRREPHWTRLQKGLAVGYRKGAKGGTWIGRFRDTESQHHYLSIGLADDALDADGVRVFDFDSAQAAARAWFAHESRKAAGLATIIGPYTVADTMRDYVADYTARSGRGLYTVQSAINAHILPALGSIEVAKLTTARLRDWLHGIAAAPALVRSKPGKPRRHRPPAKDADALRRRRAAANRIFNVLQAALNHAWRQGKVPSDDSWRKVERFTYVDAPVVRYLTEAECKRLVNACAPDFRQLVRAALLTGCRYGELTALRCADFNPDAGTLLVRASKSGKARHVVLTEEAQQFFADEAAGRVGEHTTLRRSNGEPWKSSDQQRPLALACKNAKISPTITFHVLRHTHGSMLAMKGVPMAVIAKQLGHADTRMTEKHYAHLSPSYVADTIRASFPMLGITDASRITSVPKANRR